MSIRRYICKNGIPLRLILMAGINILASSLVLVVLFSYLSLRWDSLGFLPRLMVIFAVTSGIALVSVSINVLRRKHGGHMAMAAVAAIFYGYLAAVSIFSYLSVSDLRFHAGYARNAIIFSLLSSATLWSTLSRKTCEYFHKQGRFDGGRFF